jgi:hypothetical protein
VQNKCDGGGSRHRAAGVRPADAQSVKLAIGRNLRGIGQQERRIHRLYHPIFSSINAHIG